MKKRMAPQLLPRVPLKPTSAAVRRVLTNFESFGSSSHSQNRGLLQYVIDYCEEKKIPYRLTANPGYGYYLEKMPSIVDANRRRKQGVDL